jgi:hypothetical protein
MSELEKIYLSSFENKFTESNYFLISTRKFEGSTYMSFFSHWQTGPHLERQKEMRSISLMDPEKVKDDFDLLGQKIATVNSKEDLLSLSSIGGHSLISTELIKKHYTEILKPVLTVNTDAGYLDYASVSGKYLQRKAQGTYRMEILTRDGYRCRLCGASTDDSPHVSMEVHHIKPWEEGGISVPDNLITLCRLCHSGIRLVNRKILQEKVGVYFSSDNYQLLAPRKNCTFEQFSRYRYFQANLVTLKVRSSKKLFKLD